ncbi:Efflux pump periplasmic linker BepD precursor [Pirellulimonas nuda]|uniref:Efflux pump periplasmic linker BepD n=1 Tax=Pirellulimonas nuda TaxID=2528009 RepID=A0A518DCK2_9BACT|nr:efflux RND transporter periplasmic adaptor subunit [Pirellulimonas nuda]QDU89212.1 Efflux pump periplasmic linker BepD precursor [Pirellulimonas nuda]
MRLLPLPAILVSLGLAILAGCDKPAQKEHEEAHKILVTRPVVKDVVSTQQYVCQIHSWRHIEVCALEGGYLEKISVQEGQAVKEGDLLFKILPVLYQARLNSEIAEAQLAQIELDNTQRLYQQNVVAQPEVALAKAKLAKAQSKVDLTRAELDFATIEAPFEGIIDTQRMQQGSLIAEGDVLTTLSDNNVMWVYFNVPEARYLEYEAGKNREALKIELMLANGEKFPYEGKIGAIEADFNNETGNIAFRADFPNPDHLLRHGQTGTVLVSHVVKDAVVIPQRATYEILAKKYAYVVGDAGEGEETEGKAMEETGHAAHAEPVGGASHSAGNEQVSKKSAEQHSDHQASGHEAGNDLQEGVVHQREIVILSEQDDIYLINEGLNASDKIVLEGIRQVRDGEAVEYEFRAPEEVLEHLKYKAE